MFMSRQAVKKRKVHNSGVDRSVDYIFGLRLSKRDFYKQGSVGTVYPANSFWGPLLFIVIQIAQVVIAVIPED